MISSWLVFSEQIKTNIGAGSWRTHRGGSLRNPDTLPLWSGKTCKQQLLECFVNCGQKHGTGEVI